MKYKLQSLAVLAVVVGLVTIGQANASTIYFMNAEVDLGPNQVILTDQYNPLGLQFSNVYKYIDYRDPFTDPTQYTDPNSLHGGVLGSSGISNWDFTQPSGNQANIMGTVQFLGYTSSITVDWWTIGQNVFSLTVYDSLDNIVGFFSGMESGTNTINGAIAYFTFEDHGGMVAISNLTLHDVATLHWFQNRLPCCCSAQGFSALASSGERLRYSL